MDVVLNYRGVIIKEFDAVKYYGKKLHEVLEKFTFRIENKKGPPTVIYAYNKKVDYKTGIVYLIFPRSTFAEYNKHNCIIKFPPKNILSKNPVEPGFLYHNQKIVIEYLLNTCLSENSINLGYGAAVVNLPAGQGKTLLAAGLIMKLNLKALYITKTDVLVKQGMADMKKYLYDANVDFAIRKFKEPDGLDVKGKKVDKLGFETGIMFIIINSALKQDVEFFKQWSIIIYDEIHSYTSKTFSEIFKLTQTHVNIGLSATTNDKNNRLDEIYYYWCSSDGKVIMGNSLPGFELNPIKYNCQARVIYYYAKDDYSLNLKHQNTGEIFVHYMHEQAIEDPTRVSLCINEIISLYLWRGPNNERHIIYAMAEEKKVLVHILKTILEKNDINQDVRKDIEKDSYMLISGADYEYASKHARILWSTYGYGGTGVNIVGATAIVLLNSRKSGFNQIFGRILRRGSDINIPRIVVDIVDARTCLKHQLNKRSYSYEHYNFEITEIRIREHNL